MKKLLLFVMAVMISLGLKAQCGISVAVDFTATDCHGTEVHLFDILDQGQYVLIDFFYCACGPCQQACPKVVDAYSRLGCNMHDVYFMEISNSDNDVACQTWCNTYGVEYPTISAPAGGQSINNTYGINAFPTVILIAPDRNIVIRDLWPINNSQTIVDQLAVYGIQEHDCNAVYNPEVSITMGEAGFTSIEATFTPNEDCAQYKYVCGREEDMNAMMQALNLSLEQLINTCGETATEESTVVFTENILPGVEYTIHVMPFDVDGNIGGIVSEKATTLSEEVLTLSADTIVMSQSEIGYITVYNYTVNDVITLTCIRDTYLEDPVFAYLYEGETINEGDEIEIAVERGQSVEIGIVNILEDKGIHYVPVAIANSTLEDINFVVEIDASWGVEESTMVDIYPNPANEQVTISLEGMNHVTIFNTLGQMIQEVEVKGNVLNLNTSAYEEGIYIARINNEKAVRFIVKH